MILRFLLPVFLALLLAGCGTKPEAEAEQPAPVVEETQKPTDTEQPGTVEVTPVPSENEEDTEMRMMIGDTPVSVQWEKNEAVEALEELVKAEPLRIQMSMYGGFEQVGSIGKSLPRSDTQTTTSAGDIVLYSGNQIVVFYGSNSWAYTRLGHITDKSSSEMTELLGKADVTITIEKGR